ncbi:phosphate uptake regulator PhoU [Nitrosarchaeum sp.]|uniref:phosphate signaling complex PhoU family protein n=1 Tax=Nitrosarchaeum sp. TaxID=2026886 RepID=UPI00247B5B79|nr:phosphate uptake regulator PhoU [Nitrosarchaeum sp.]MCV0412916.1 phosphate uptake regulator PhoU [Nitrosarchaeum sp.]
MKITENTKQTRKIQLSGGSTYIISLPKEWVEELKIKVGENVTVVKNSNESLTLFPREHSNDKNETIAIINSSQKDSGESVKRKIIAAYLAGYKTIRIKTKGMKIPTEHSRSVRDLVHSSMIGTEIVESSSDAITIQILTRLPELSFESALKRMYLMATNMIKESIEALEEMDIPHADEIVNMDDEVDRFGLYMRRNLVLAVENQSVLEDMGLKRPSNCLEYRTIVSKIERIGDHASLIAKRIKFVEDEIDSKIIIKIKKLSEKALQVFEDAITAVQNHDFQKGENVTESISQVINEEKEIMAKIKDAEKNSTVIKFVLEDLRRIVEYSGDIAEIAIDENIQSIISKE